MIKYLKDLGNRLDLAGHTKEADLVDSILFKLAALPHDEEWEDIDEEGPSDEEMAAIEAEDGSEEIEDTLEDLYNQILAIKEMLDDDRVSETMRTKVLPEVLKRLEESVKLLTDSNPAWGGSMSLGDAYLESAPMLPIAEASKE